MKTVVITGGTSGIGLLTTNILRAKGNKVIVLANTKGEEDADFLLCDVANEENIKNCFNEIKQKYQKIDVLINNAGYGLNGALELLDSAKIKKQFDVNVFGLINCTKYALPLMSKGGRIINIASAMALFPVPYRSMYGASKAAVLSLSMAQRMELSNCGIDVCAVCPGNIKTNFTKNKEVVIDTNERYGDAIKKAQEKMDSPKKEAKRMKPEIVANKLVKLCFAKKTKPMIIIGKNIHLLYFVNRFVSKNLILKATAKVCG